MTLRRRLGAAYEWSVAGLGSRALARLEVAGLPDGMAGPLRYLVTGVAPVEAVDRQRRIEAHRATIAGRPDPVAIDGWRPLGLPGTAGAPGDAGASPQVTGRWLAEVASVPPRWGMFLYLCAEARPGPMLELGSCIGVSGAYLAASPACDRLVSIDGAPTLARLAQRGFDHVSRRATVTIASFDAGLDHVAADATMAGLLGLAFVDGDHEEASTLRYVGRLRDLARPGAWLVLDDIYFSPAMWRAWDRLRSGPGFAAAIDVGRFGVLVLDPRAIRPARVDFARYTGWWRVRRPLRNPVPA